MNWSWKKLSSSIANKKICYIMMIEFNHVMVIEFYKNNMVWLKTNINVSDFSMTDYDSDYFYASNDEQKSDSLSMRESFTSRWEIVYNLYKYIICLFQLGIHPIGFWGSCCKSLHKENWKWAVVNFFQFFGRNEFRFGVRKYYYLVFKYKI